MMTEDTWYFAYGSNLSMDRKECRTGRIRAADVACLPGYRLAFNKRGGNGEVYANIVPDADAEVWGVIYRCSPEAMDELDRCEGVEGGHYTREPVEVITESGNTVLAVAYVAGPDHICEDGRPSDRYLSLILDGARQHGLPKEYVRRIQMLGRGEESHG